MTKAQERFLKYVRTKMIFSLRLRSESGMMQPVHIRSNEIQKRFFKVNYKEQIRELVDAKELEVTQKGLAYYYKALTSGGYDLSLMQVKPLPQDNVTQTMLRHLRNVSMPPDAERTPYFDLFLKHKDKAPYLFFKVDDFSGRVYTPVTTQHRTHRPNLKLYSKDTTGLDVQTMQPLLLGKILTKAIGTNDFSTWLNEGKDIYLMLQDTAKLSTRDHAKKRFFEILFSKPSDNLSNVFGSTNWITWINEFKALELPQNPHNKGKPHSNLAWLLQKTEVQVMRKVWNGLVNAGIPFLSIHDEVIIQKDREHEALRIFSDTMAKEFIYFKINGNKLPDLSSPQPKFSETVKREPEKLNEQLEQQQQSFEQSKEIAPLQAIEVFKREQPENWNSEILELENFFNSAILPTQPVQLKQAENIKDISLFIGSHLDTVKRNNGNRTFLPFLDRLQELKKYLPTNLNLK